MTGHESARQAAGQRLGEGRDGAGQPARHAVESADRHGHVLGEAAVIAGDAEDRAGRAVAAEAGQAPLAARGDAGALALLSRKTCPRDLAVI